MVKKKRVLVIGGCHTYGYGVEPDKGYIQQLIKFWEAKGVKITVSYYAPIKLKKVIELLANKKIDINDYDHILLHLAHFELIDLHGLKYILKNKSVDNSMIYGEYNIKMDKQISPSNISELQYFPQSGESIFRASKNLTFFRTKFREQLKAIFLSGLCMIKPPHSLVEIKQQLTMIIQLLEGKQKEVIFINPFPIIPPVSNALRFWGTKQIRILARKHNFKFLDVFNKLNHPKFFLNDGTHINTEAHFIVFENLKYMVDDVNNC